MQPGSGKYVQEMILQSLKNGYEPFLVAGVPKGFKLEDTPLAGVIDSDHCLFVRFEDRDLDFKVVGMSDVMPYPAKSVQNWDRRKSLHIKRYSERL